MILREKPGKAIPGWQFDKDRFEKTHSSAIIAEIIDRLQSDRVLLSLAHVGYQSGITVLKDQTAAQLAFERPEDWPGTSKVCRIIFKDNSQLWHHFDVSLRAVTEDTLFAARPTAIFRLQRRDHFRMPTPPGSVATFTFKGKKFEGFFAKDLSAGGVMLCTKKRPVLTPGDMISEIVLSIPAPQKRDQFVEDNCFFEIPKGKVIHVSRDDRANFLKFGIAFMINKQTKDALGRYIRQAELEALRKWISP